MRFGLQLCMASISGVAFPSGLHATVFIHAASSVSSPIPFIVALRYFPDLPTNGRLSSTSFSPGASPTTPYLALLAKVCGPSKLREGTEKGTGYPWVRARWQASHLAVLARVVPMALARSAGERIR